MFYHSSFYNTFSRIILFRICNTNFRQFCLEFSLKFRSIVHIKEWLQRGLTLQDEDVTTMPSFPPAPKEKSIDNSKAKLNCFILLFQIAVETVSSELKCLNYKNTFLCFNLIVNLEDYICLQ